MDNPVWLSPGAMAQQKEILQDMLLQYLSTRQSFDDSLDGYRQSNENERAKELHEYSNKILMATSTDELDVIADELLGLYRGVCSAAMDKSSGYVSQMERDCQETIDGYRKRLCQALVSSS